VRQALAAQIERHCWICMQLLPLVANGSVNVAYAWKPHGEKRGGAQMQGVVPASPTVATEAMSSEKLRLTKWKYFEKDGRARGEADE